MIMAAGMAKAGWKPVVAIYSTFLQRSFDQLIHDVCLQNLPVTICVDRAGLVGDDGKTHQGIFDIAYTRGIPNMTVAAPQGRERAAAPALHGDLLRAALRDALSARRSALGVAARPEARRPADRQGRDPPRGQGPRAPRLRLDGARSRWRRRRLLAERGVDCGVANARFAKPLDLDLLARARAMAPRVLTLEEHLAMGGFGSARAGGRSTREGSDRREPPGPRRSRTCSSSTARRRCSGPTSSSMLAGVVETALELFPDLARGGAPARPAAGGSASGNLAETVTW